MTRHLAKCGQMPASTQPAAGKRKPGMCFHLVVEGRPANAYWLHVAVPAAAPLSKLDEFLRGICLECCGHMSAFEIEGEQYTSAGMDGEMGGMFGEKNMRVPLQRVVAKGMKFLYEYDFGSTTALALKVVALWEPGTPNNTVQLLARNEPLPSPCDKCGKGIATQICTECDCSGKGWLCDACAETHECGSEMLLPVVNSPRAGVCAYTG